MRMLAERAKGMQTDVYVRFIDYVKAFDRVRYEALFEKQVRRRQYIDGMQNLLYSFS